MSKEKRRVPKLRFPGFTEDWEQRKLGEVVTINPKTELPDEFKYVDLESVVGTNLLGFQVIKKENAPSRAQRLASYGDVFYQTVRPYQRNNYLFENVDKDMVFSTGYAQLRSKLDSYFLLTLVQNDNFVKVVLDNCTGTSYPAINGSELGKITVQIPSNEVEANQIGKVFRGIDKSITLHQRKLDNLKLKKKALLQKLFPKNGERYPELRFPGFTDAWEQRKLGEYANFRRGSFPQPYGNKEWYDGVGSAPFVQVVDVGDNLSLVDCTKQRISKLAQPMSVYAEKGSVLVTLQGSIGRVAVSQYDAFIDRTILIFQGYKYKTNSYFWAYIIKNKFSEEALKAPGGTIKTITKEALSNFIILYPKFSEQEQIGSFFEKLDKLITLHQRKLDHLQLQKKALLQQMFV